MRRIYIVPSGGKLTPEIEAAAAGANCTEIVRGVPKFLRGQVNESALPHAYEEPDDPEAAPRRTAAGACRNFLTDAQVDAFLAAANGTATNAQRDAIIKQTIRALRALMVLSRHAYRELSSD